MLHPKKNVIVSCTRFSGKLVQCEQRVQKSNEIFVEPMLRLEFVTVFFSFQCLFVYCMNICISQASKRPETNQPKKNCAKENSSIIRQALHLTLYRLVVQFNSLSFACTFLGDKSHSHTHTHTHSEIATDAHTLTTIAVI